MTLVRIDEEEKEIAIFVLGEEKRGYLASILSSFKSINELYEGLEYEELVPCCCRTCKDSEKPHYFKYSLLQKYNQKSRGVILCENSFQDVLVNDLLGTLIKPEELEEEISKLIGSGAFKTKNYLEKGKIDEFIKTIKLLFSSVSYLLFEKSEKAYHMPLFLILRTIFGNNAKGDEIQAKGRSDIILNLEKFIYILELKLDGTSQMAIDQIHHNRYYDPYILDNKTIELIAILRQIISSNACICGDLVDELGLAQPTISQHLKELKNAGLIQGTIEGVSVCYCINPKVWNELQQQLAGLFNSYSQKPVCC